MMAEHTHVSDGDGHCGICGVPPDALEVHETYTLPALAFVRLLDWVNEAPAFRSVSVKLGIMGVYVRMAHANQEPSVRATGSSLHAAVNEALADWDKR